MTAYLRRLIGALVTRRGVAVVAVLALAAGTVAGVAAQQIRESPRTVNTQVVPAVVPFSGDSKIWIMGSGFPPGTQVDVVIRDAHGLLFDITDLMEPTEIVADEDGSILAAWPLGRAGQERRGVLAEGLKSLRIIDQNLNLLDTAPFLLCRSPEETELTACQDLQAAPSGG